jgi:hypothetical protein
MQKYESLPLGPKIIVTPLTLVKSWTKCGTCLAKRHATLPIICFSYYILSNFTRPTDKWTWVNVQLLGLSPYIPSRSSALWYPLTVFRPHTPVKLPPLSNFPDPPLDLSPKWHLFTYMLISFISSLKCASSSLLCHNCQKIDVLLLCSSFVTSSSLQDVMRDGRQICKW